jgi:glycine C-acetyltransferase
MGFETISRGRSSALRLADPFDGFFAHSGNGRPAPLPADAGAALLDSARARQWFDVVRWGIHEDLYTYQQALQGRSGRQVCVEGRTLLMMSSYDYLGLIGHPAIQQAAIEAVQVHGTGSGGVRLLTGTTELHRRLEQELAVFKGAEAAITFTSGYVANLAAISALLGPKDLALVDDRAHRSILDGCRLAAVPVRRFRHNDPQSLQDELQRAGAGRRTLIVVEGVYSMDGDICVLPEIVELKRRHGAALMVDEAHALGVLGDRGRGVHEHFGLGAQDVDIWSGCLSKAIPSNGGFVAGSRALIIYLQHGAAPFFFSGAACPASVGAALAALAVIDAEPWRLQAAARSAARLRSGLRELGFDTGASQTPIVPVVLGDNETAWRVARRLQDNGILVSAVVPPAVAGGSARLRLCTMATHTTADIDSVLQSLARCRDLLPERSGPAGVTA